MDCTIKQILGEAGKPLEEPLERAEGEPLEGGPAASPEETEVHELANLWTAGNKGEVVRRFTEMDNELSVKLVFAIGLEGALELARMVDQALEHSPAQGEVGGEGESTEPARTEPAEHPDNGSAVKEIIGHEHD